MFFLLMLETIYKIKLSVNLTFQQMEKISTNEKKSIRKFKYESCEINLVKKTTFYYIQCSIMHELAYWYSIVKRLKDIPRARSFLETCDHHQSTEENSDRIFIICLLFKIQYTLISISNRCYVQNMKSI